MNQQQAILARSAGLSWVMTAEASGTVTQARGLAQALTASYTQKIVRSNGWFKKIPASWMPVWGRAFNSAEILHGLSVDLLPDFIISCGGRSVVASLYCRRWMLRHFGKKVWGIHIQNPGHRLAAFDFVVAPEHDGLVASERVMATKGTVHDVTQEALHSAAGSGSAKGRVVFMLGGPNRYYAFSNQEIMQAVDALLNLQQSITQLVLVASRRTPQRLLSALNERYAQNRRLVLDVSLEKQQYLKYLASSEIVIVSCDSVSMLSEASMTGKPVYVFYLSEIRPATKFRQLQDSFQKLGISQSLNEFLQAPEAVRGLGGWSYPSLNESQRVANWVWERIERMSGDS
ncbi:MAG: mitochondrial fission ELM1 family protein [Gammaproteobacteria bacterium]